MAPPLRTRQKQSEGTGRAVRSTGLLALTLALPLLGLEGCVVDRASAGLGSSLNSSVKIYRVGLQRDFDAEWLDGRLSGYVEGSANCWRREDALKGNQHIEVLALSPVLVFRPVPSESRPEPYLEVGVGGAWLSETMISWRNFGSHLQFEDRLGAGIRWRSLDLNFRYLHYSNANLAEPNHGLDILLLSCAYSF